MNPEGERRALLVHLTQPFTDAKTDVRHQNRWQARELARLLAQREYCVDVVAPGGTLPPDAGPYEVVVDLHPGITRYRATSSTIRIAYVTGSNPRFSNAAEKARLAAVTARRGAVLHARRQVAEFSDADLGICNAMFFIGSESNLDSYRGLKIPPVHFVRNFAYPVAPIERATTMANGFLFLASVGQVHKGLDLLLEVFARRPEWTLHVCSSFHEEPDFCRAYRRELFDCPNIIPHGFQSLDSNSFAEIARSCSHIVLPSCSEANAGSVISGMAAGLIPLVSQETGFESEEVEHLPSCSLDAIETALERRARLPHSSIANESQRVRRLAEARHSQEACARSLQSGFEAVLTST